MKRGFELSAAAAMRRSDDTGTDTGTESLVQQHLKDEVDINTIVRRFGATGQIPVSEPGIYGDFTGIEDFDDAVALVDQARERFMELPADVRERFGNNPGQLIAHVQSMSDEELGVFGSELYPADKPAEPAPAPPVLETE